MVNFQEGEGLLVRSHGDRDLRLEQAAVARRRHGTSLPPGYLRR